MLNINLNSTSINSFELLITGLITLFVTFAGVFLAQTLSQRSARKRREEQEKKVSINLLKYLFAEIISNYRLMNDICKNLDKDTPPDKYEGGVFIYEIIKHLSDKNHISYLSTVASYNVMNDQMMNAIEQIYYKISEVKLKWSMLINIGRPKNETEINMLDTVFTHTQDYTKSGLDLLKNNIPIIISFMKEKGITYKIVINQQDVINLMDDDGFSKLIELEG
ncbi:MAG: hypothetical protein V1719_02795 [Patescibacteria group bacterium]